MYTPLHVHSEYSILDSSASIDALVKTTKDFGIKSLALTDSGNMFGAVEFYKKCMSENIKPIIGSELWIAYGSRTDKKKIRHAPHACPFVLLVKNLEGYKNLCKLSSIGYLEGFYYKPRIDKEVLKKYSKGLICLSGSLNGNISHLIIK